MQNTLFYLSPQNYERHLFVELDNDTKISWENKKNELLLEMKKNVKKNSHTLHPPDLR